MNGWQHGVGYAGPAAQNTVSIEATGEEAATWRSLKEFVARNRQRADRHARDRYVAERSEIVALADAGRLSEGDERKKLKAAEERRDQTLAQSARMWPDLSKLEAGIRERARNAALAAIAEVWAVAVSEQSQHWPDHAYKSRAEGYV